MLKKAKNKDTATIRTSMSNFYTPFNDLAL